MTDNKKLSFGAVALLVAFGLFSGDGRKSADLAAPSSSASPSSAAVVSLDLRPAFDAVGVSAADRRRHAADLRRVFTIARDGLAWDAKRPVAERDFARVEDLDRLVVNVRHYLLREWSFAGNYPKLGPTIGDYLKLRIQAGPVGALTDEGRAAWLNAMAEIERACEIVEAS